MIGIGIWVFVMIVPWLFNNPILTLCSIINGLNVITQNRVEGELELYSKMGRGFVNWNDEMNDMNPLYVRGYFRENMPENSLMPKLKGMYSLKIIAIILWIITLIYEGYAAITKDYSIVFERLLMIGFVISAMGFRGFSNYYAWRYRMDFRYVENKNGIWKPFTNILSTLDIWDYKSFKCNYWLQYNQIRAKVNKTCRKKKYAYVNSYRLKDNDECDIYMRNADAELTIFQLIHIHRYSEEKMQELNEVFEKMWKEHVVQRRREESAAIIFLLCIDEKTWLLNHRLLKMNSDGERMLYAVSQKTGRYRLPSILVFSEKHSLYIPANKSFYHGKKKYQEMRQEFLDILGISERYFGRSYREEDL